MTEKDIDRIQSAIDHIKSSVDIDPWAMEIAVEAMQEKMEHLRDGTKKKGDAIWRQDALDKFEQWLKVSGYSEGELNMLKAVLYELYVMPPAQPEAKPIDYRDCADAMLMMWMWNVLTDGEYYRIMDKLNRHETERRNDG